MTEAPTAEYPAIPSSSPTRSHPIARGFGLVIGWLSALAAAIGLGAHFLDTGHQSLVVLASGAWVLAPFSVLALGLHLWRRGWFAVVVAVLLVTVQVIVYGPLFVGQGAPSSSAATVHVLTQNLLYGEADPRSLVARVRAGGVDVFVAQELTAKSAHALRAAGLDELLPYSTTDAMPRSAGTGLWSRYPINDPHNLASVGLAGVTAQLTLPGGVHLTAVTLHPDAPFPQNPNAWYDDLGRIRRLLGGLPPGPVIVGGDFNSTMDNARFRQLLVDGWRDGAEQAGAGLIRSWPSNKGVAALVGIDHVLTRGTVATSVATVHTPGSDHLGLLATVVVPR